MDGYNYVHPAWYLQPPPDENADFYNQQDLYSENYGLEELYNENYVADRKPSRHYKSDVRSSSSFTNSTSSDTSTVESPVSRKESSNVTKCKFRSPSFMDAFRVLYLEDAIKNKSPNQYLMTKKKREDVDQFLKRDGLGSKRWLLYPRPPLDRGDIHHPVKADTSKDVEDTFVQKIKIARSSSHVDRRVKVEGEFFKKYRNEGVDKKETPAAKLKPWELVLYKKLGFIQIV